MTNSGAAEPGLTEMMELKLKLFKAVRGLDYQGQWYQLAQALTAGTNEETANDVARVVDAAYEWANAIEAIAFAPVAEVERLQSALRAQEEGKA